MLLISGALQVKGIIDVDNLQEAFVIRQVCVICKLLLVGDVSLVRNQLKFVLATHHHHWLVCFQGSLCQVTALIVEECMRVSAPSDALHQDASRTQISTIISQVMEHRIGFWSTYTCELKLHWFSEACMPRSIECLSSTSGPLPSSATTSCS